MPIGRLTTEYWPDPSVTTLQRLLFKPILRLMDQRATKIETLEPAHAPEVLQPRVSYLSVFQGD